MDMTKTLLTLFILVSILSCGKIYEQKLIGYWRLERSYTRTLLGRDNFETGYEDGIFRFEESGAASYKSATDTLTGYWDADFYSVPDGNGGSRRLKYLRLHLADFTSNKLLVWDFDDFHFRNNWRGIRAIESRLGPDRCYEFVRQ